MLLSKTVFNAVIAAVAAGTPAAAAAPGAAIYPPTPRYTYHLPSALLLEYAKRMESTVAPVRPIYVRRCYIPSKKKASDPDPRERCEVTTR